LPGQTEYTMGLETVIDGKKCYFTADNFFHQDMFSGSGGWMGLNRSFPSGYAASAQKVLDARPDWVMAEHGGPFEFNAEDFKRRVQWGQAAARAADAISPSGNHRFDWDPHHVHVEPLVQKARPGDKLKMKLVAQNPLAQAWKGEVALQGRGIVGDVSWKLDIAAGKTATEAFTLQIGADALAGRQVFPLRITARDGLDGSDAFVVVDVER